MISGYKLKIMLQRHPDKNIQVPQALERPVPHESVASAAQTWIRSNCSASGKVPTMMDVAQSLIVAENVLRYERDSERRAACDEAFEWLTGLTSCQNSATIMSND
jgi:hypothetical protein